KYLREPEPWLKARDEGRLPKGSIIGPYLELFRDRTWTRNLIVGALISSAGVIGLWAIGEYATDLQTKVFTLHYEHELTLDAERDSLSEQEIEARRSDIPAKVENARSNAF